MTEDDKVIEQSKKSVQELANFAKISSTPPVIAFHIGFVCGRLRKLEQERQAIREIVAPSDIV